MATSTSRLEHLQLRHFLGALRFQLWWRDGLVVLAASAVLGALVSFASLASWLAIACLAIGIVVGVVRRPSVVRAARVADRQLHTSSRLATAAEVLDGRLGGALAPAQLDDAWRSAAAIRPWDAYPYGWRRVQLALLALLLSLTLVSLTTTGVLTPPALLGSASTTDNATVADMSGAQGSDSQAVADAIAADKSANPAGAAQTLDDVQSQVAQSQAASAALQKLGDALRPTAAAGDIGNALRAGNYDTAATELTTLATESDQLSKISKRELSAAMERSAIDSAQLDPPLAVAEDRVARALNRNVYTETRSTLQDLAKAVGDAKNGIISQEELAKELDQLQQQQSPTTPGGGGGDIGESAQGYIPDIPGDQPNQVGLVQGAPSTISVPGPEGDPSKSTHSGVGQEAGGDPFGDLSSRLDVPPVDLSVETQLGNDQGRNKPNPNAPVVKISDTTQNGVKPSDVVQPGDPVQAVAERSVESTEQRSTVRTFFQPTNQTGSTP